MTTLELPPWKIAPLGLPEKTLGWTILGWTAEYLLQPDGPDAGEPWKYTREQAIFVLWWYAVDANGRFVYRRGMLRRMKGWGKDPFGASLCCVEFVGPCRFDGWDKNGDPIAVPHKAGWVQIAAVSRDQTRSTMTIFPGMLSPRAQEEFNIDLGKEIIYGKSGRLRIEAVTSSPRALEGQRSTFVLKNETHLWVESNEGHAMSDVIARNLAKSRDGQARSLAISNAHLPGEDSDAERDYNAWLAIQSGASRATGFLYDSVEAPPETELTDPASLHEGILVARGDSDWLDVERLTDEIYDPKTSPSMARRFYLNQITAAEDAWVAPFEWDACAKRGVSIEPNAEITLGLDGSKSNDHTTLVGCDVETSHLFTLGIWNPEDYDDGIVPLKEVNSRVRQVMSHYDVVGFYSDVRELESYIDLWEEDFGEQLCSRSTQRHPIAWDMRTRQQETTKMIESFYDAIIEREVSHEGEPRSSQYVYNAKRRTNNFGVTVSKEHPMSKAKIDWLVAAALARRSRQDYLALPDSKRRRKKGVSIYVAE